MKKAKNLFYYLLLSGMLFPNLIVAQNHHNNEHSENEHHDDDDDDDHDDDDDDGFCDKVENCINLLDLQGDPGPAGPAGANGIDGINGTNGTNGINCWDLNGNGVNDLSEDINGDGIWNASDCQGTGAGGPDNDWQVTGNNMYSIPSGNVSVGTSPSSNIKFYTSDNNNSVQLAGAFYKVSTPGQVGAPIGVRGLSSGYPGSGTGVEGYASSNEVNASSVGVYGLAYGNGASHYGAKAQSNGNASILSIGIQSVAAASAPTQYGVQSTSGLSSLDSRLNCGIRSIGYGNDLNTTSSNFGIHTTANPGTATVNNVGIYTRATRPPSNIAGNPSVNYGIWAYADNDGVTNLAGYFVGDIEVTGSVFTTSDEKLKTNIKDAENAMSIVNQLSPKTYNYKQDIPELTLPKGAQQGLIAQDVEKVLPNLVHESKRPAITDDEGNIVHTELTYKTVNYIGLIPVLTGALKEQYNELLLEKKKTEVLQNKIDDMSQQLSDLQEKVELLLNEKDESFDKAIQLENKTILLQNDPNPFNEKTLINYSIPNEIESARLLVYNNLGELIKEVKINGGTGKVSIDASLLSNGIYSYSILANGQILASQKMIKTQ